MKIENYYGFIVMYRVLLNTTQDSMKHRTPSGNRSCILDT